MERDFLIIGDGSSMLQISWRHGMPLVTLSEATRPTVACQTSQLLWCFPRKCLRISTRLQQSSALSFHFSCLEGILGFHQTCPWPSSGILSASTWQLGSSTWDLLSATCDQSYSHRTQDEWLKGRAQWRSNTPYRTLSTKECKEEHC